MFFASLFTALVAAAPLTVTDSSVQLRARAEARDDRFFQKSGFTDRDILAEWRLRGKLSVERGRFRIDAELQDQRIAGSEPAAWLDISPMATPTTTTHEAGLRLAGKAVFRFRTARISAGRFAESAARGLLMGPDEAGVGYRPLGAAWTNGGSTWWAGIQHFDPVVGPTSEGLAKYAGRLWGHTVETGVLARRAPSRPLFAGVRELVASPYVDIHADLGRHGLDVVPLAYDLTLAYQLGKRAYRPVSSAYKRDVIVETEKGFQRFAVYYSGKGGQRSVRAGFARGAVHVTLPVSWEPVVTMAAHVAEGGGDAGTDRNFVPHVYDTNQFFGQAGYFGARNVRAASTALYVPLRNGWSARVAVWRADVVSPLTGLFLENGALLDPATFTGERRAAAHSKHAVQEWDAELRWRPVFLPLSLRLAYSEVRHGAYVTEMAKAAGIYRKPPAQYSAVQIEYKLE